MKIGARCSLVAWACSCATAVAAERWSVSSVAMELFEKGDYGAAWRITEKDLARCEAAAPSQDECLDLLFVGANFVAQTGDYRTAESLARKSLAVSRRAFGEQHGDTATGYNNTAGALAGQGLFAEAEELYRRALQIRRIVLGERHPDTALSRTALASVLSSRGLYADAEPLFREALAIALDIIGERATD